MKMPAPHTWPPFLSDAYHTDEHEHRRRLLNKNAENRFFPPVTPDLACYRHI